jgi:hypothetical protein
MSEDSGPDVVQEPEADTGDEGGEFRSFDDLGRPLPFPEPTEEQADDG